LSDFKGANVLLLSVTVFRLLEVSVEKVDELTFFDFKLCVLNSSGRCRKFMLVKKLKIVFIDLVARDN
jgi:hypothetical protein